MVIVLKLFDYSYNCMCSHLHVQPPLVFYIVISGYYLEFITIQSVLEKVRNFFTPSYWLSGAEEDDGDAAESGMTIEENAALMSSHQQSRTDNSSRHQSEQQALAGGSTAWKKNLIVLNEDMETGPSLAFQNDRDSVLRPSTDNDLQSSSQSSTNTLKHNTKVFIPTTTVNMPKHSSTPVKKQGPGDNLEVLPVQVEGEDVTRKTAAVQSSAQQERTTRVEESTSATVRLQQHGSMLTPPGQFIVICVLVYMYWYTLRATQCSRLQFCNWLCDHQWPVFIFKFT